MAVDSGEPNEAPDQLGTSAANAASDNNNNKHNKKRQTKAAMMAALDNEQRQMVALELASKRVAVGAHLDFRCEWLAEPTERMEFTWYLNNSASERRILSTVVVGDDDVVAAQSKQQLGADENQLVDLDEENEDGNGRTVAPKVTKKPPPQRLTSKLSFRLESPSDFGQLLCLAKNELGEQKRACAYSIERGK